MNLFDEEIHGKQAPKHMQDFVARVGGKTPAGVPRYRLVWAPSVRHKAYGEFHDWDENIEHPSERGGLAQSADGIWEQGSNKPERVVIEMRWLETYPYDEGWILEKWYPRRMFGDPESWAKNPLLGPYPENGRYVDCCNPTKRLPTVGQIENLISAIEYKIANKQGSMQARIAKRYEQYCLAEAQKKAKRKAQTMDRLHEDSTFLLSNSLAAGAYREKLANRLREKGYPIEHVGN